MAKRPNMIWFMSDQHRGSALSCHGDANLTTPNLDVAAASGVDCHNAVSGFPLCCPFRGSLLTGLYPHKAVPGHEIQLDPALPLVTDTFHEHGYTSAYFGKWH
ncbi:sulfatase-like hydrolase/transferase, partial [Desulfovibrio sp. OttesenSCG-928-I05]|nr:sulfatase-like hydrolase/transferase [Desulfovibrio sp. OttesenSCG-928-I05]